MADAASNSSSKLVSCSVASLMIAMQSLAPGRAHPAPETVAAIKPIGIGMKRQDLVIAFPGNPIVLYRPVESDFARRSHRKAEAIDLLRCCQCPYAVDWLLRKRLT